MAARSIGQIRIIGGQWRGRKLMVPTVPHLRPTPDRVRETVFNWLAPVLQGACCLDAFAGSGALGFEALSRGAAKAVMVDNSPGAIAILLAAKYRLKAHTAEIYQATAPHQIKPPEKLFDILFLDPPYQTNNLLFCCFYFEEKQFLAKGAYIYLESRNKITANELPADWKIIKSKQAGQVAYHLILREAKNDA